MDIEKVEDTVKKSESLINTVWGVLVRNWGKLLVIALIACTIWFAMLVMDEVENPTEESETEQVEELSPEYDDYDDYDKE